MRYIVPTAITDGMLVSSSVPEADHPAWASGTTYTAGARVIRTSTHSIYERLATGAGTTPPESDTVNWARVAPTNRWAMLDGAVGTVTTGTGTITVTLAPGLIRGLALLDLDVEAVSVTMTVGAEVAYHREITPIGTQETADNYYDYFFDAIVRRRVMILTDLPPFAEGQLTITASGAGAIGIGTCVVGAMYEMGDTQASPAIGIVDYSRKSVDEFGVATVVERAYSKSMTLSVVLPTAILDNAAARLARVRAKPVVWIGSERLDSLVVYGFLRDWSVDIRGMQLSWCSLKVEGLT